MSFIYYVPALVYFIAIFLCNKKLIVDNSFVSSADSLLIFLGVILVFILTGFKGDIDPDYKNYLYYFEVIPSIGELTSDKMDYVDSVTSNVETGMIYVMALMKSFSLPFQVYYIFTALVIGFLSFKLASLYKGYEAYLLIFLYCFYFQPYFIQTRYFISVLSSLICFIMYSRSSRITFDVLFYFFLGIAFHTVGLFILPLILALRFKNILVKYWYLALLVPLLFMGLEIDSVLSHAGVINPRYDDYVNNDLFKEGDISSFYIRYFLACALAVFCYLNSRFHKNKWDNELIELWLLNLSMLSVWSVAWKLGMLYRVALLFEISWVFYIVYGKKYLTLYARGIVLIILLAYALFRLFGGVSELEPFVFNDFGIF